MVAVAPSSPQMTLFSGSFRPNSPGNSDRRGCGALASLKSEGTIEPGVGYVLMVGRCCTSRRGRSLTREMGNAPLASTEEFDFSIERGRGQD